MDPELDEAPELSEYYDITDAGDAWHLRCLSCRKVFAYLKADHHAAQLLVFLNHAASHDAPSGEEADRA